jgi:hypothetical protein
MGKTKERWVAGTLRQIGTYVKEGRIGQFEAGHGFKHHYSVARDALRIALQDDIRVDEGVLLVGGCTHDFEQRGQVNPGKLRAFFLDELKLEPEFVDRVLDAIGNHSLDDKPETVEGEIIWAADKANYPNPGRFRDVAASIRQTGNTGERQAAIVKLHSGFAEKWVRGIMGIPLSPLMQKYPTAMELFNERVGETLKYIRNEGRDVFGSWADLYDQKHQEKQ